MKDIVLQITPFCASGRVERPPSEHESNMRPLHQLAETNSRVGRLACTSASLRGADFIPMVKRNKGETK